MRGLASGRRTTNPRTSLDPTATGTRNLRAALERVLQGRCLDAMAEQKCDIHRPGSEGNPANPPISGRAPLPGPAAPCSVEPDVSLDLESATGVGFLIVSPPSDLSERNRSAFPSGHLPILPRIRAMPPMRWRRDHSNETISSPTMSGMRGDGEVCPLRWERGVRERGARRRGKGVWQRISPFTAPPPSSTFALALRLVPS